MTGIEHVPDAVQEARIQEITDEDAEVIVEPEQLISEQTAPKEVSVPLLLPAVDSQGNELESITSHGESDSLNRTNKRPHRRRQIIKKKDETRSSEASTSTEEVQQRPQN